MQRVLDMFVVVIGATGMVGLGYIAFVTLSATPHDADAFRVILLLILAGVTTPFFMARSLEKLDLSWSKLRLVPRRTRPITAHVGMVQSSAASSAPQQDAHNDVPTLYFDYLFKMETPPSTRPPSTRPPATRPPATRPPRRKTSRGDAYFSTH